MEKIEQILKKIEEQVKDKKECAETFFNWAEGITEFLSYFSPPFLCSP